MAGGYDPDDIAALFYNGVDPALAAGEIERAQSDTPSLNPPGGHMAMLSHPAELADRLVTAAEPPYSPI